MILCQLKAVSSVTLARGGKGKLSCSPQVPSVPPWPTNDSTLVSEKEFDVFSCMKCESLPMLALGIEVGPEFPCKTSIRGVVITSTTMRQRTPCRMKYYIKYHIILGYCTGSQVCTLVTKVAECAPFDPRRCPLWCTGFWWSIYSLNLIQDWNFINQARKTGFCLRSGAAPRSRAARPPRCRSLRPKEAKKGPNLKPQIETFPRKYLHMHCSCRRNYGKKIDCEPAPLGTDGWPSQTAPTAPDQIEFLSSRFSQGTMAWWWCQVEHLKL